MKKIILIIIVLTFIVPAERVFSQQYKLGLGIRLSNNSPTLSNSISAKYFLDASTAIEGLLSYGGHFGIGALYDIHKPLDLPGLQWYYGFGGYLGFQGNDTYLGPTGTVGLDYKFEKIPLNLSLDWKPELDILPKISFVGDAFGLSARFTLN